MVSSVVVCLVVIFVVAFGATLQENTSGTALGSPFSAQFLQSDDEDEVQLRLPNDTIPVRYDIFLTTRIHAGDFSFNGRVDIGIKCVEATNMITLHSRVREISLVTLSPAAINVSGYSTNDENDFLVVNLNGTLVIGAEYVLSITYTGEHTAEKAGWHRASYTGDNNNEIWYAMSNFGLDGARQAFPSYDEPDRKAIFGIHLTYDQTYDAISNMPIDLEVTNTDGTKTTNFEDSPIMSTYAVAFVVSDYQSQCKEDIEKRQQCAYGRPDAQHLTTWPLDVAVKSLIAFENLMQHNYTLPKLDHFTVAAKDLKDIAYPAIESWGLVTYRDNYFFLDEVSHTAAQKRDIITTIMHSVARQWFGDLVSPKWWTYAWLNEGFSYLFEYYVTDLIYPELKLPDLYTVESLHSIMWLESRDFVRPVTHYVQTKAEFESQYNYVIYQKAATVLRMIMFGLGEQTFYKGLRYYLEENAFGTVTSENLYDSLQKAATEDGVLPEGLTIQMIMDSWLLVGGYPVLDVVRSGTQVTARQSTFLMSNAKTASSKFHIPITYTTSQSPVFEPPTAQDWFRGSADSFAVTIPAAANWIIFNKQQTSFYRVNYDETTWRALAHELKNVNYSNIHPLNRAQLLDDSFDLAIYDRLNVTLAFNILSYMGNETSYLPWAAAEEGFSYYYDRIVMSDIGDTFTGLLQHLTEKLYETYGIEGTDEDDYQSVLGRQFGIKWACRVGNEKCQSDALQVISTTINDLELLPKDYETVIPCAGFRALNNSDFNAYMELLDLHTGQLARNTMIDHLTCSYVPENLFSLLNRTVEESLFSEIEAMRIYSALATSTAKTLRILVEFLADNPEPVLGILSPDNVASLFDRIASACYSNELSPMIQEVARAGYANTLQADFLSALDTTLNENADWMEKIGSLIVNYIIVGEKGRAGATVVLSVLAMSVALIALVFNM